MSRAKCVWVHEIAVLAASGKRIRRWEIWEAHNTRKDAEGELRRAFEKRPSWVAAKFHRATNRIRKYVPEARANV